ADDIGGMDALSELIDVFLAEGRANVDEYVAAVARGDAHAAMQATHTLKSSAATFAAHRLAELCRAAEAEGRAGHVSAETARELRAEADRVFALLQARRA
ncbi:MAG TPA: Hpt domain-containing protein, partial [Candidatus Thermoplasmatota archaeon]|nr:Hpt domain-containing protein [Candidatus Thermoplasmatota archaeon]